MWKDMLGDDIEKISIFRCVFICEESKEKLNGNDTYVLDDYIKNEIVKLFIFLKLQDDRYIINLVKIIRKNIYKDEKYIFDAIKYFINPLSIHLKDMSDYDKINILSHYIQFLKLLKTETDLSWIQCGYKIKRILVNVGGM